MKTILNGGVLLLSSLLMLIPLQLVFIQIAEAQTDQTQSTGNSAVPGGPITPTAPSALAHALGTTDTIQVSDNGTITVSGAEIAQIAGTTFFTRVYWGDTFLRITVRTGTATQFTKRYGGIMGAGDVSVGDFVTAVGTLYTGESSLDMTATSVKDWSVQTENDQFTGIVTSIATSTSDSGNTGGFWLAQQTVAGSGLPTQILVALGTSTTITRGSLSALPASAIQPGDKITLANGIYDHTSNILSAASVVIYQDMSLFLPRNFAGILGTVSLASNSPNSLPAQLTLAVGSVGANGVQATTTYTVNLPPSTQILAGNRSNVSIARFLAGDAVRVYGSIRQNNHSIIDAQIVRNLDL